jgi:hypothetical protein
MTRTILLNGRIIMMGLVLAFLTFAGCEGSDTRQDVDNTVEEFSGKTKMEQMKVMERDIEGIRNQQSDRFKELEDTHDSEE